MKDVKYVGVDDLQIDLFEGQFIVPDGIAYNSYLIEDEKIAVVDSVDGHFCDEWLKKVEKALGEKSPDYIIVQHMEPDHSACVEAFCKKYPKAQVVGNQKTFVMLGEYFGEGFPKNRLVVKDGEKLSLGKHELTFISAPMVHWPEVMFTYDDYIKTLFSADAFGKFGALSKTEGEEWACEARRYYFGIVGKYGVQAKAAIAKAAAYEIKTIAPLHGVVLEGEALKESLAYYAKWTAYEPEKKGVFIAYSSVYGHTATAAKLLKEELEKRGVKCEIEDLLRSDWAENVETAFEYSHLVIAATTYNAGVFPAAKHFIDALVERGYRNRTIGFIENGTWAPVCAEQMQTAFETCKDLTFAENIVKIRSALSDESRAQISALADELKETL